MPPASANVQHLVLFVPCCSTAELLQVMYQHLMQCFFFITTQSARLQALLSDCRASRELFPPRDAEALPSSSSPIQPCGTLRNGGE